MQFREHKLDNGLTVVAECNPQAYSTAVGFFVNTGARDESMDISGVSHFLEHMAFKGTPNRSAEDVNRELDEIGSHSNAFTSEEQTVYYAAVVPEYQSQVVELLADIMRPSLRNEDFETEKLVIVEEIHKYDDQPPYGANERCMANYFGSHPLGQNVLGSVESVTALTPGQMRAYFDERYSPENITLTATGNVDFDQLIRDAEQHCGAWQRFATKRNGAAPAGEFSASHIQRESATQQYVVQISGASGAKSPDRFAHRLLASIYGDETGSRLFWALIDTGLAEYAVAATYEFEDCGVVMTFLSGDPERAEENLRILRTVQSDLFDNGITPDELELARNKVCSQAVRGAERPMNRLFSVGNNWLQRQCYATVAETINRYQAVTCDQINSLLRKFPLHENARVSVGPLSELAADHGRSPSD